MRIWYNLLIEIAEYTDCVSIDDSAIYSKYNGKGTFCTTTLECNRIRIFVAR